MTLRPIEVAQPTTRATSLDRAWLALCDRLEGELARHHESTTALVGQEDAAASDAAAKSDRIDAARRDADADPAILEDAIDAHRASAERLEEIRVRIAGEIRRHIGALHYALDAYEATRTEQHAAIAVTRPAAVVAPDAMTELRRIARRNRVLLRQRTKVEKCRAEDVETLRAADAGVVWTAADANRLGSKVASWQPVLAAIDAEILAIREQRELLERSSRIARRSTENEKH